MPTERLLGEPVAASIRADVIDRVETCKREGTNPTLATVLASDDPADERFMDLKHEACAAVGIDSRGHRFDPDVPPARLYDVLAEFERDPAVDAVFVQTPIPGHVDENEVRRRLDPDADVDCFHPLNRGRLVRGDPHFIPATPAAVTRLLSFYDVDVEGKDVTIVGRSDVIGKPLANLLWRNASPGNATVTVCHSFTTDLGEKTRDADVVVTACGVPELVDGSMLEDGVVVVDVSANRVVDASGEQTVVGDVAYESARDVAGAITPVPGGVGPVTLATLVRNVVLAAERQSQGATPPRE